MIKVKFLTRCTHKVWRIF